MPIPAGGSPLPIIPGEVPVWAPSVDKVANHVPYMTVDVVTPGSQQYRNTFDHRTTPTGEQVRQLIDAAWPSVLAATGPIVEQVWPLAQSVAALRAAAAIVRAYPRDDGDLARAAALDARADADLARLITANADAGGGPQPAVPALLPVWSFPEPAPWGDSLL
ncbi:hypothetical protein [Verrucosispora sp. WMMC514]|uniref:hypothetical protein n=1 Tax=Verrucosispora sp. WMMC514 TaxID=3015156 RepID=UPI00248C1604|nr:hypothetical protein [Verrucosispora sp. WMMC514]WBB94189.1 hypothetical protein O7597_15170 [Verrucosispora sp. WMMC514]